MCIRDRLYTTPIQWSEAQFTAHRQLMQRVWFWLEQMTSKATIDLMPRLFSLNSDDICLFSVDCLTTEQTTTRLPLSSIRPDAINTCLLYTSHFFHINYDIFLFVKISRSFINSWFIDWSIWSSFIPTCWTYTRQFFIF